MLLPSFDKLAFLTLFSLTNIAIVNVGAMPPRSRPSSSSSSRAHSPVLPGPMFVGYAYEFKASPGKYLHYSTLGTGRVAVYSQPKLDTVEVLEDCRKCLVHDTGFLEESKQRLLFAPLQVGESSDAIINYLREQGFHGDSEAAILVQEDFEGGEVMLIPEKILDGKSTLNIRCPKEDEHDYLMVSNTKEAANWRHLDIKFWAQNSKYLTVDYPNRRPHSPH
ncbi:hypothetical protein GGU10DRAFT_83542 [Lentinula aff. detonsa]|uniref:Uncharacterized protein n=1 Tax=Lentinula aff. detonsa TaxID=2804958 RepID=A0AA38KMJ8_9AGAR|nr:hypothetical protein GGU10DRAFT_83542 [Lentinula aff. detonsa]